MNPRFLGALSRARARVVGSRFAKPITRALLVAAALLLLALIGRAGAAGMASAAANGGTPDLALAEVGTAQAPPAAVSTTAPSANPSTSPSPTVIAAGGPARAAASAQDPVVLNTATHDELRRLPGIGEKRAMAILALREHLGRFRALEDLLKVKGIGRAMLRRLRPLVRLDAAPSRDAGAPPI